MLALCGLLAVYVSRRHVAGLAAQAGSLLLTVSRLHLCLDVVHACDTRHRKVMQWSTPCKLVGALSAAKHLVTSNFDWGL